MSAASFASFVYNKLSGSGPLNTSGMSDTSSNSRTNSPNPKLTAVWRSKTINETKDPSPFKEDGSLLRLLRTKSMPSLVLEKGVPAKYPAAIVMSPTSPVSRRMDTSFDMSTSSLSSPISSKHLNPRLDLETIDFIDSSTTASIASPPPSPMDRTSMSKGKLQRSASDGHMLKKRKNQFREMNHDFPMGDMPSVKNLRLRFDKGQATSNQDTPRPIVKKLVEHKVSSGTQNINNTLQNNETEPRMAQQTKTTKISRHESLRKWEPCESEVRSSSIKNLLKQFEISSSSSSSSDDESSAKTERRSRSLKKTKKNVSLEHLKSQDSVKAQVAVTDSTDIGLIKSELIRKRSKSAPNWPNKLRNSLRNITTSVKQLRMQFESQDDSADTVPFKRMSSPAEKEQSSVRVKHMHEVKATKEERKEKDVKDKYEVENFVRQTESAATKSVKEEQVIQIDKTVYTTLEAQPKDHTNQVVTSEDKDWREEIFKLTKSPSVKNLRQQFEGAATKSSTKDVQKQVSIHRQETTEADYKFPAEVKVSYKIETRQNKDQAERKTSVVRSSSVKNLLHPFGHRSQVQNTEEGDNEMVMTKSRDKADIVLIQSDVQTSRARSLTKDELVTSIISKFQTRNDSRDEDSEEEFYDEDSMNFLGDAEGSMEYEQRRSSVEKTRRPLLKRGSARRSSSSSSSSSSSDDEKKTDRQENEKEKHRWREENLRQKREEEERKEREAKELEKRRKEQAEREKTKQEQERREREIAEQNRIVREKAEQERKQREKAEQERRVRKRDDSSSSSSSSSSDDENEREKEKELQKKREREKEEQEQRRREKEEQEKKQREKEERERRAREKEELERKKREREEQDRKEMEKAEQERKQREKEEHELRQREREEQERKKREKLEQERKERERKEQERKKREREEQEQRQREEEDKRQKAKEREEKEQREREKEKQEKIAREKAETSSSSSSSDSDDGSDERKRKKEQERIIREKEEQERKTKEKEEQEREKKEQERRKKEKEEQERREKEKEELERKKKEKEEQERKERENEKQERRKREREEQERREREREEQERKKREKEEQEQKQREEEKRQKAKEVEERERREREKENQERMAREKAETSSSSSSSDSDDGFSIRKRKEKEQERIIREKEQERKRKEKEEQEREKKEQEQKKKEKEEQERREKEKEELERKQKEKEEQERKEREKEDQERRKREREEQEQREREREEQERKKREREEQERREREKEEQERKQREKEEQEQRHRDEEQQRRKEREERERRERERAEQERMAKEKAETSSSSSSDSDDESSERQETERKRKEKERIKREKEEQERKEKEIEKERKRKEQERKQREKEEQKQREREEKERKKREKAEMEQREREEKDRKKREKKEQEMREKERKEQKRKSRERTRTSSYSSSSSDDDERKHRERQERERKITEMELKENESLEKERLNREKETAELQGEQKVGKLVDIFTSINTGEVEIRTRSDSARSEVTRTGIDQSEFKVGQLIEKFVNKRDQSDDEEPHEGHRGRFNKDRRDSDVALMIEKFTKTKRRTSSSSSSDGEKSDSSSKKKGKQTAPIPKVSAKNIPGKFRKLNNDELRFFNQGGAAATESFVRTQSLRVKKDEPKPFPDRGGSLRVKKSDQQKIPKTCRQLRPDELRYFAMTNNSPYPVKKSSSKTSNAKQGFRLSSQGDQENRQLNGIPGDDQQHITRDYDSDSDSDSSMLRGCDHEEESSDEALLLMPEHDFSLNTSPFCDNTDDEDDEALGSSLTTMDSMLTADITNEPHKVSMLGQLSVPISGEKLDHEMYLFTKDEPLHKQDTLNEELTEHHVFSQESYDDSHFKAQQYSDEQANDVVTSTPKTTVILECVRPKSSEQDFSSKITVGAEYSNVSEQETSSEGETDSEIGLMEQAMLNLNAESTSSPKVVSSQMTQNSQYPQDTFITTEDLIILNDSYSSSNNTDPNKLERILGIVDDMAFPAERNMDDLTSPPQEEEEKAEEKMAGGDTTEETQSSDDDSEVNNKSVEDYYLSIDESKEYLSDKEFAMFCFLVAGLSIVIYTIYSFVL